MRHFQFVGTENAVGDARRVYQAVHHYTKRLYYTRRLLWNASRNADPFAWLVTGLLQSQKSMLPE